ncbi:ABC transporter, ATP-binding protein (cluster 5, nickel/peptides/opines) / ABC transporter, ATP-binding protein (cluster 5, nickel/peptides/opines) [Olavius algarvensis Delta 1 endosymbiont]|nr:ABC transporter, ATP-binding protein (cluster 5, nickel/peptides/opines) / ABC transporter, ATP-binding protein (cluster 5, nickel/peptides/opines) [Olavius algarvensis Delta 1 endosymbiont]
MNDIQSEEPLVSVKNLVTRFDIRSGFLRRVTERVHAVEKVSLSIAKGETLALVGESGCGKSTLGRSILQLDRPTAGSVKFEGLETLGLSYDEMRPFRKQMQMIFQDPFGSLNPRMVVGDIIAEPMIINGVAQGKDLRNRVLELLELVELGPEHLNRYPHAFSGGQRQRICIARALGLNPKLIIADESVAALDVTIQAQVINLMMDLQAEFGISFLFISHDMAVVERIAHRVAVMYIGEIVEIGDRRSIFENPQHAYTKKLLASVPIADPRRRPENRQLMIDEIPSVIRPVGYKPTHLPMRKVSDNHFVRAEKSASDRYKSDPAHL